MWEQLPYIDDINVRCGDGEFELKSPLTNLMNRMLMKVLIVFQAIQNQMAAT